MMDRVSEIRPGDSSGEEHSQANDNHQQSVSEIEHSNNNGHLNHFQESPSNQHQNDQHLDDNDNHHQIDAHTHVITEAPHTVGSLQEHHHDQTSPNSGHIVDHQRHGGSPTVQHAELPAASVEGTSIDDNKPNVHNDVLHSHLYANYQHQEHHQTRYVSDSLNMI